MMKLDLGFSVFRKYTSLSAKVPSIPFILCLLVQFSFSGPSFNVTGQNIIKDSVIG